MRTYIPFIWIKTRKKLTYINIFPHENLNWESDDENDELSNWTIPELNFPSRREIAGGQDQKHPLSSGPSNTKNRQKETVTREDLKQDYTSANDSVELHLIGY